MKIPIQIWWSKKQYHRGKSVQDFKEILNTLPAFLRDYMYMYAESEIANGGASLAFKHIPATFRFIITNKRPAETTTISSIALAVEDGTGVAAKQATVSAGSSGLSLNFSTDTYNKVETALGASVAKGEAYTAYALALPLASNTAFSGKELQFSITATDPANTHLAFTLDAEKLAGANTSYGEGIYNWVGGKSYTIRMSLSDVLTLEGISVTDWQTTDSGITAPEAEEE